MMFDRSDSKESQTIEALVPMVDLFAVLAIVFMIYSNDEITFVKMESQKIIAEVRQEAGEAEQARKDRREFVARKAGKSMEQIKQEREQKAQELLNQFTEMLAAQQSQAAVEYEELVTRYEYEHEEALAMEVTSLNKEKRAELDKETTRLKTDLAKKEAELEQENQEALILAKLEYEKEISSKVVELTEDKQEALARARQQKAEALRKQESTLAKQQEQQLLALTERQERQLEETKRGYDEVISSTEKVLENTQDALTTANLAREQSELEAEKQQALKQIEQARVEALAAQNAEIKKRTQLEIGRAEKEQARQLAMTESALEAEKRQALAQAQQEHERELARQQAALAREKERAEQALAQELAATESTLEAEKRQALAEAQQEHESELARQQAALAREKEEAEQALAQELAATESALEAEKRRALADAEQGFAEKLEQQKELVAQVEQELVPYVEAMAAKKQIVDQLNENFKDFDSSAVEIDKKTGKVKLHFQESYFVRGSHKLSEDMKDFLRIMIPKYARSIYANTAAAEHVESLKISGMTSPVYMGKYIDIDDTSPRSERARSYNMELSNKRALAMYNFIFDEEEMGDYQYRGRLKADMGIAALGFQSAKPVSDELVGKTANCIKYDCQQEQATILQFRLLTES